MELTKREQILVARDDDVRLTRNGTLQNTIVIGIARHCDKADIRRHDLRCLQDISQDSTSGRGSKAELLCQLSFQLIKYW